jgi:hypothetical protein
MAFGIDPIMDVAATGDGLMLGAWLRGSTLGAYTYIMMDIIG